MGEKETMFVGVFRLGLRQSMAGLLLSLIISSDGHCDDDACPAQHAPGQDLTSHAVSHEGHDGVQAPPGGRGGTEMDGRKMSRSALLTLDPTPAVESSAEKPDPTLEDATARSSFVRNLYPEEEEDDGRRSCQAVASEDEASKKERCDIAGRQHEGSSLIWALFLFPCLGLRCPALPCLYLHLYPPRRLLRLSVLFLAWDAMHVAYMAQDKGRNQLRGPTVTGPTTSPYRSGRAMSTSPHDYVGGQQGRAHDGLVGAQPADWEPPSTAPAPWHRRDSPCAAASCRLPA
ncbi:hypothetical protein FALBO_4323 [Fusarium albosuccineum]|uniref:Uncharacterized protein n=1 Tax=Fusarium albosuccineum TaxID=1237068 RepID=A0A8H4LG34_9HYPO|nr:hypothetical protein FALBO_4323 [Fusarium albosuccineum]